MNQRIENNILKKAREIKEFVKAKVIQDKQYVRF